MVVWNCGPLSDSWTVPSVCLLYSAYHCKVGGLISGCMDCCHGVWVCDTVNRCVGGVDCWCGIGVGVPLDSGGGLMG